MAGMAQADGSAIISCQVNLDKNFAFLEVSRLYILMFSLALYSLILLSRFPRPRDSPGLFPENSRTWKVLENHLGCFKSWKLKLEVLENAWKNIL